MSGLIWKLNRFRVMTFGEILFRIWRAFLTSAERYRLSVGWQPLPKTHVGPKTGLFGQDLLLLSQWQQCFQLDEPQLQYYLEGKIAFFGHDRLDTGMPVHWHREPVTGIESPLIFGKKLNYRDDAIVGNVKFLWELGRHQHLVPLAVAYAVSSDARYKDCIIDQIETWINSNPYGMGIHWCSALEVSLRMISWALVHSILVLKDDGRGLFDAVADSGSFGTAIYQHCYFVRHFLSRHSSANNHLIGELTGLWVGCQVFNLGDMGDQWAHFAQQELESEAAAQVYADGVDKEQAFYYHMWVLEYLLFARMVAARADREFSVEFDNRLHAMLTFLKDVSTENAGPPQIGDADDGFVSRFDPDWPQNPYKEFMSAADTVFGLNGPAAVSHKAFWYHAMAADALKTGAEHRERSYPVQYKKGGYAILGGDTCHLVMDSGDLGYLGIAAHGHADALSFCLAIDGVWWLVDPGTYAYHSDASWRNYFRGTKAHNTVVINDLDQSVIAGAFMWSHKARARLLSVTCQGDEQIAIGEHDGYLRFGICHQRTIMLNSVTKELQIIDRLVGGSSVKADIYFHFAPEVVVTRENGSDNWRASHPDSSRQLIFILDKQWDVNLCRGQTEPVLGWYSPSLEVKVPTNTLHGSAVYSGELSSKISILVK